MVAIRQCNNPAAHEPHDWSQVVKKSWHDEAGERLYQFCNGVERLTPPEGATKIIGQVTFRNLEKVEFDFVTRENVPTRIIFDDIQPGDARAMVSAVESDSEWAFIDIRIMARKPYVAREIEDHE